MSLSIFTFMFTKVLRNSTCHLRIITASYGKDVIIDPPEVVELLENNYRNRPSESLDQKKARLMYQSRKRGMLENDLILSTFAHKYLAKMDDKQADEYDKIINMPSNDWDLYNWAIEKKPTPKEFENSIMNLLKEHAKNTKKEQRFKQPEL